MGDTIDDLDKMVLVFCHENMGDFMSNGQYGLSRENNFLHLCSAGWTLISFMIGINSVLFGSVTDYGNIQSFAKRLNKI